MRTFNYFVSFSAVMLLFCFTNSDAQSTLDFEGQGFGTQNFSENGINWSLNGWINIRDYGGIAYSGSNAAMLGINGDNIQSNHNITVASLISSRPLCLHSKALIIKEITVA